MNRRQLLASAVAAPLAAALPRIQSASRPLTLIALTDLHFRNQDRIKDALSRLADDINAAQPNAVLINGDCGDGSMGKTTPQVTEDFQWLARWAARISAPIHWVVGNHDVVGWAASAPTSRSDGKQLFQDTLVKAPLTRRVPLNAHWHLLVLDSIDPAPTAVAPYSSLIGPDQQAWLKSQINETPAGVNLLVATHSPLLSTYQILDIGPYATPTWRMILEDAKELDELLKRTPVRAVIQGHTHIRESVTYAGRTHLTAGAVSGNWWSGLRFGLDANGYAKLTLNPDGTLQHGFVELPVPAP